MTIAQTLLQIFSEHNSACIDFLFPLECCFCGCAISQNSPRSEEPLQNNTQPQLCNPCAEKLPPLTNNACLKCGAPQGPYILSHEGCIYCRNNKFIFSSAIAMSQYENDFRKMCLFCKQDSSQRLTWYLANRLWQTKQHQLTSWQCDGIVHVPMHWTSRLTRHVHPAESIASCLAKQLKTPHLHRALKQSRRVTRQAQLPPSQRRKNVQNLFHTTRFHNLAGRTILLVDDIFTTGTTANECAKALKKAGAKQVYVAVLARGMGR